MPAARKGGMPLIILCGQPSSGKSTVARAIEKELKQLQKDVVVISEQTLRLDRNAAYSDSASEKKLRGSLKATADRSLSKQTTVILDSINAIKGYRYELWCLARAVGTKYCVVHCDIPLQISAQWNAAREPLNAYTQVVFDDLASRFERPDSRNRWDKPLYTINTAAEDYASQVQEIVVGMTTTGTAVNRHKPSTNCDLVPTSATSNPALSATNLLHEVDKATQEVITAVSNAQSAAAGGAAGQVALGPEIQPLVLQELVSMPELRRHKRAFIKLATQISNNRVSSAQDAKRMFADYLQTNLK